MESRQSASKSNSYQGESNGYSITARKTGSMLVINATHLTQKKEYEMTYYDDTIPVEIRCIANSCDQLLQVMIRATRISFRAEDRTAKLDIVVMFVAEILVNLNLYPVSDEPSTQSSEIVEQFPRPNTPEKEEALRTIIRLG